MSAVYFDFPLTDGSRVCVQRNDGLLEMPHIRPDGVMPPHAHEFYEMVLVMKNSCRHIYNDDETTLLPGDIFLIPPHRVHAYRFTEDILYYNCQFYMDAISPEWIRDINALTYDRLWDPDNSVLSPEMKGINRQGILHMSSEDAAVTAQFFDKILQEQEAPRPDSERMKKVILHLVLAGVNRIREKRLDLSKDTEQWKQKMITDTLGKFQRQIDVNWDMASLASEYHVSLSYFRSIFRQSTGLSPRQYLKHMRITRAVDMIQHHGMSLPDASVAVGIHDLNYFSRLCKQVTGYSPSHFRRKWTSEK